jgi:hypothetical protein
MRILIGKDSKILHVGSMFQVQPSGFVFQFLFLVPFLNRTKNRNWNWNTNTEG